MPAKARRAKQAEEASLIFFSRSNKGANRSGNAESMQRVGSGLRSDCSVESTVRSVARNGRSFQGIERTAQRIDRMIRTDCNEGDGMDCTADDEDIEGSMREP